MESYQSRPVDIKKKDLNIKLFNRFKKHFDQDSNGDYLNLESDDIKYKMKLPKNQSAAIMNKRKMTEFINQEKHFNTFWINLEKEHIFQFQYYLNFEYFEILQKDLPYLLLLGYEFQVRKLINLILNHIQEKQQDISLRLPLQQVQDVLYFYEYVDEIIQDDDDPQNTQKLETFLDKILTDNPHLFKQNSIQENKEIEVCFRQMKITPFKSLLEKNAEIVIISDSQNGRQTFDPQNYLSIVMLKIQDTNQIKQFLQQLENSKTVLKDQQIKNLKQENLQIRQQLEEQKRLVTKQRNDYEKIINDTKKQLCIDYLSQSGNIPQQTQQYTNQQHYSNNNQYQSNISQSQSDFNNQPGSGNIKHHPDFIGCQNNSFITTSNCQCQICSSCQALYLLMKDFKPQLSRYNQKCWGCDKGVFTDQDFVQMQQ